MKKLREEFFKSKLDPDPHSESGCLSMDSKIADAFWIRIPGKNLNEIFLNKAPKVVESNFEVCLGPVHK